METEQVDRPSYRSVDPRVFMKPASLFLTSFLWAVLLCPSVAGGVPLADDAEVRARLEKQIQGLESKLADLDRVKREARNIFDQEVILAFVDVVSACNSIAIGYEQLRDYSRARDWYQKSTKYAEECNEPLVKSKQISLFDGYFGVARMALLLGDYAGAAVNSEIAVDRATPLDSDVASACLCNAHANAILGEFEIAKSSVDGALAARTLESRQVEIRAFAARTLAAIAYLKGDLKEAKSQWSSAAGIDGRYGDIDLFDPVQGAMNAAIFASPKDVSKRLARARYLIARGGQLAVGSVPFGESPLYQGGIVNVAMVRSAEGNDFESSALLDLAVALREGEGSAIVYYLRALARIGYNEHSLDGRKYSGTSVDDDLTRATFMVQNEPEVLFGLAKIFVDRGSAPRAVLPYVARGLYHGKDWAQAGEAKTIRQELFDKLDSKTWAGAPTSAAKSALEWKERGNAFFSAEDWRGALKCYDRAIQVDPKLSDAHYNRGRVFESVGCYDWALESYQKAVELNPQHPLGHYSLAVIHFNLRERDKAVRDLEKALKCATSAESRAKIHFVRARIAVEQFESGVAIDEIKRAKDLGMNSGAAREILGMALLTGGRAGEAATELDFVDSSARGKLLRALALFVAGDGSADDVWKSVAAGVSRENFIWIEKFVLDWYGSAGGPKDGSSEVAKLRVFLGKVRDALKS